MSQPTRTVIEGVESVSDFCVARPNPLRGAIVVFVYYAAGLFCLVLASEFMFPQWRFVLALLAAFAFLAILPATVLLFWWRYRFRVDAEGFHQQLVLFENNIHWDDNLFFLPNSPWLCRTAVVRGSGGLLSRMRGKVKQGFVSVQVRLPHRWLISNLSELRAAVDRFAPPGHPLRDIYGVESHVEE